jgi:hypothetical protein
MRFFILTLVALSTLAVRAQPANIVIDGRLDEPQWAAAALQPAKSGVQVRMFRDAVSLFVGVTAPAEGFSSVCVGGPELVRILHASAALGAVEYRPSGNTWSTMASGFVYGMRDAALTEAAAAARRAYLNEHGWVASTARMGGGRTQEFQIDLGRMPKGARIAIGYYGTQGQGSVLTWPDAMRASDGCAAIELVRGMTPATLSFDPARWMAIP